MEDINADEFNKKAEDLIKEWHFSKTRELDTDVRGLELSIDTALVSFKFIPYILATIYYSWMNYRVWSKHKMEKDREKLNLWTDTSIDRIFLLTPSHKIDKENCTKDIKEMMKTINEDIDLKNHTLASDILSDKFFKVLQKYYPEAGNKDRELVDYVIRAELKNLKS